MNEENLIVDTNNITEPVFEPTVEGAAAAIGALKAITQRSFSERHPELGKMINCPHCGLRHRQSERICEQKFAKGRYDLRDPKPLLIAGETPETEILIEGKTEQEIAAAKIRLYLGAKVFVRKRRHPRNKPKTKIVGWPKLVKEYRRVQEDKTK